MNPNNRLSEIRMHCLDEIERLNSSTSEYRHTAIDARKKMIIAIDHFQKSNLTRGEKTNEIFKQA